MWHATGREVGGLFHGYILAQLLVKLVPQAGQLCLEVVLVNVVGSTVRPAQCLMAQGGGGEGRGRAVMFRQFLNSMPNTHLAYLVHVFEHVC